MRESKPYAFSITLLFIVISESIVLEYDANAVPRSMNRHHDGNTATHGLRAVLPPSQEIANRSRIGRDPSHEANTSWKRRQYSIVTLTLNAQCGFARSLSGETSIGAMLALCVSGTGTHVLCTQVHRKGRWIDFSRPMKLPPQRCYVRHTFCSDLRVPQE